MNRPNSSGGSRSCFVILSAVIAVVPGVGLNAAQDPGDAASPARGIIVSVVPGEAIEDTSSRHCAEVLGRVGATNAFLVAPPNGNSRRAFLNRLRADSRVQWAELNGEYIAPEGATQSFWFGASLTDYENQYAPGLLGLNTAHATSTGSGTIVAVLDTGVDPDHPLLSGKLSGDGANFISSMSSTHDTGNGVDDDGDGAIDEMVGHGTFVAGLVVTVAPGTKILPVTVLNSDGVGSSYSVSQGIYYAINAGVDVINLSLVSPTSSSAIADAVAAAEAAGIVVVASVGNTDEQAEIYPAANTGAIAVAATDAADLKASFSDSGTFVTLSAPGVGLVSAWQGGYALSDGASFAAPLVSGTAALIRSVDSGISPADVALLLGGTSLNIDPLNPGYEGMLGAGRIQPAAALY